MKTIIHIIILLFMFTNFSCLNHKSQITKNEKIIQPQQYITGIAAEEKLLDKLILNYFNYSREGNTKELKKIVTKVPQSYRDYENKKAKDLLGEEDESESNKKSGVKIDSPSMKPLENYTFDEIIKTIPKAIREKKLSVENKFDYWIKNNEGRIRVKIKGVHEHSGLAKLDFYVVKPKEKWKIFKVSLSIANKDEKYPN